MIKMVQKQDILTLYRRGVSLRAIAKELQDSPCRMVNPAVPR